MKRIKKKFVIELDEDKYKKMKKYIEQSGCSDYYDNAIAKATPLEEELEDIKIEVNTRKKYIDGDLLFSKIAGHSNYHGDSILSAISCLQEGKEISTIPAIGDNE